MNRFLPGFSLIRTQQSTLALFFLASNLVGGELSTDVDFCIIGAGPAGLQLGHYLQSRQRNYVIFERDQHAGSFFRQFPRQRKLISINKRLSDFSDDFRNFDSELSLRHDWNSLLQVEDEPAPGLIQPRTRREEGAYIPRFQNRSKLMYPPAQELYEYLREFAVPQANHILYNTTVVSVKRRLTKNCGIGTKKPACRFFVKTMPTSTGEATGEQRIFNCSVVTDAAGFKPMDKHPSNKVKDPHGLLTSYTDVPTGGMWAEGKRVLILGHGNAAVEVATSLFGHATEVHVIGPATGNSRIWYGFASESKADSGQCSAAGGSGSRQPALSTEAPRFSWETHYVGDVRAVNAIILDHYQLKSLDTFAKSDAYADVTVLPCAKEDNAARNETQLCFFEPRLLDDAEGDLNAEWVTVLEGDYSLEEISTILRAHKLDAETGFDPEKDVHVMDRPQTSQDFQNEADQNMWKLGLDSDSMEDTEKFIHIEAGIKKRLRIMPGTVGLNPKKREEGKVFREVLVRFAPVQNSKAFAWKVTKITSTQISAAHRVPFHSAILCLGWRFDDSHYRRGGLLPDMKMAVKQGRKKKYPLLTERYESVNIPGLYFVGTNSHGYDHRKSSGGFIHGFRYNTRALFWIWERERFGVEWPHTEIVVKKPEDTSALYEWLHYRIVHGSGTYQMFQVLTDTCIFLPPGTNKSVQHLTIRCFPEMPFRYLQTVYKEYPRLVQFFQYGRRHTGPRVFDPRSVGSQEGYFAEHSTFLHPRIRFYPRFKENCTKLAAFKYQHIMVEDLMLLFSSIDQHTRPFLKFLKGVLGDVFAEDANDNSCQDWERQIDESVANEMDLFHPMSDSIENPLFPDVAENSVEQV